MLLLAALIIPTAGCESAREAFKSAVRQVASATPLGVTARVDVTPVNADQAAQGSRHQRRGRARQSECIGGPAQRHRGHQDRAARQCISGGVRESSKNQRDADRLGSRARPSVGSSFRPQTSRLQLCRGSCAALRRPRFLRSRVHRRRGVRREQSLHGQRTPGCQRRPSYARAFLCGEARAEGRVRSKARQSQHQEA
jgi:hypothetical protein